MTRSIGYHRDDGDFAILATLNNNDEALTHLQFESLEQMVVEFLAEATGETIVSLERQDAPDYVEG